MIRFNDHTYGEQIAAKAGTVFHPVHNVCIAREENGRLLGGVIYTNFTGESVAMHSASWVERWITRDLLWICFDYPFNQMGVARIFGQVPADNAAAIRFNTNLGFKVIATIEGVYKDGIDCLVMRMERDECRHLAIRPRNIFAHGGLEHGRQV